MIYPKIRDERFLSGQTFEGSNFSNIFLLVCFFLSFGFFIMIYERKLEITQPIVIRSDRLWKFQPPRIQSTSGAMMLKLLMIMRGKTCTANYRFSVVLRSVVSTLENVESLHIICGLYSGHSLW